MEAGAKATSALVSHCPVDNGFAPTETECRLAEVRSRSMHLRHRRILEFFRTYYICQERRTKMKKEFYLKVQRKKDSYLKLMKYL